MRGRLNATGKVLAVILTALPLVALAFPAVRDSLPDAVEGNRSSLYETVTSVAAAMLGFLIAALAILLGLVGGERVTALITSDLYGAILRLFMRTTWWLAVTVIIGFLGIIVDRDYGNGLVCSQLCDQRRLWIWLLAISVAVAAAQVGYCLKVLRAIVKLVADEKKHGVKIGPPEDPHG